MNCDRFRCMWILFASKSGIWMLIDASNMLHIVRAKLKLTKQRRKRWVRWNGREYDLKTCVDFYILSHDIPDSDEQTSYLILMWLILHRKMIPWICSWGDGVSCSLWHESLSMVVTEMYQIVAGGQEANQGQLWSKGMLETATANYKVVTWWWLNLPQ